MKGRSQCSVTCIIPDETVLFCVSVHQNIRILRSIPTVLLYLDGALYAGRNHRQKAPLYAGHDGDGFLMRIATIFVLPKPVNQSVKTVVYNNNNNVVLDAHCHHLPPDQPVNQSVKTVVYNYCF
jgi:hypothetical protein